MRPPAMRVFVVTTSERYWQGGEAAQSQVFAPFDGAWCELHLRHTLQQGCESCLALDPCQRRAKAEVAGPREGNMAVVLATDIQAVRVGETLRVAIGSTHDRDNRLAFADHLSPKLYIIGGQACCVLAWAFVAQQFLYRRWNQ